MKTWKGIAAVFFGLIIITTIGYISLNPETQPLNDSIRKTTGLNYIRLSDGFTHYQLDGPESGEVVVLVHGGTILIGHGINRYKHSQGKAIVYSVTTSSVVAIQTDLT